MRILHVITDTNIGGAGRYLLTLLTQRAFDEIEVIVSCPDGELGKRIDAHGIRRAPVSPRDVSFSLPLLRELISISKAVKPDLIHTHSSFSGRVCARILNIPVIYTKHNLVRIPSSGRVPPKAGPLKRLINRFFAQALSDKVIAVSEGVAADLQDAGIPAGLIATVQNGIDLTRFTSSSRTFCENDELIIGTASRLHPQKGMEVLIEAAKIVAESDARARFVIAGTGPLEESVREKIESLGLESRIILTGFVEDIPAFLSGLDIYVLSSHYEGLPLAVLEAMAAGLPIVATAVGGVPEAVVNQVTGILVTPGRPEELARAILQVASDRDLATRMGEESRARVEKCFNAETMAQRTVAAYDEVLGRKETQRGA